MLLVIPFEDSVTPLLLLLVLPSDLSTLWKHYRSNEEKRFKIGLKIMEQVELAQALQQIHQGLRDGGLGLTSAICTAPAASYVANLWSDRAIHTLPWFPPEGPAI